MHTRPSLQKAENAALDVRLRREAKAAKDDLAELHKLREQDNYAREHKQLVADVEAAKKTEKKERPPKAKFEEAKGDGEAADGDGEAEPEDVLTHFMNASAGALGEATVFVGDHITDVANKVVDFVGDHVAVTSTETREVEFDPSVWNAPL